MNVSPPPPPKPTEDESPPPSSRPSIRFILGALLGLVIGVLLATYAPLLLPDGGEHIEREASGRVSIAHVADPRVSDGPGNAELLRQALRELRGRPGAEQPVALVVSGEILLPTAHTITRQAETNPAADAAQPPAEQPGGEGQDTVTDTVDAPPAGPPATTDPAAAEQTAETDTTRILAAADSLGAVLASSPLSTVYLVPAEPLAPATLSRIRAATDPAGVFVQDLTACHRVGATQTAECRGDLLGTRWSLIGFPAAVTPVSDSAKTAFERSKSADRRLVVVLATAAPGSTTVDSVFGTGVVDAVLSRRAAHLPGNRVVPTPPLSAPEGSGGEGERGFGLLRLGAAGAEPAVVPFDPVGQRFVRASTAAEAGRGDRWWDRLFALGEPLGEPARSAIYWLAVLTAFLTVAALWEVPPPRMNADAPDAEAAAAEDRGVFKSNLGRTVISGLTGIAAVTVLGEVWGMSGTSGQAFFVIAFVQWLLLFLVVTALARGLIEAIRHRVVAEYRPPVADGKGGGARVVPWLLSLRPTSVVFADTFTNVLIGRSWMKSGVWEIPLRQTQESLLLTIRRTRDIVSSAVAEALRRHRDSWVSESDFRVNVSLMSAQSPEVFYVAAASGAANKVFTERSVAFVAVRSGEARWWKQSYNGKFRHLVSTARLQDEHGRPPSPTTPLKTLRVQQQDGSRPPRKVKEGKIVYEVEAVLGNGERIRSAPVEIDEEAPLSRLLAELNESPFFGGGFRSAQVSVDSGGHLVVADSEPSTDEQPSELAVLRLSLGGVRLESFEGIELEDVQLFPAPPPERFAGHDKPIPLAGYFEHRGKPDYGAFMVIPIPWARRGELEGQRRAGIQISFRHAALMDALWGGLETRGPDGRLVPNYEEQEHLLTEQMLADAELRATLRTATGVLETVIQEFNEAWYRSRGRQEG